MTPMVLGSRSAASFHAVTDPEEPRASRVWRWALAALIVIECAPIWAFRHVPTQDGPSHLHNAAVLANYGTEPIYRQYYTLILLQPAGNSLTQFLLAGLMKAADPITAEKILLTVYVVLMFLAFRYLLGALTPHVDSFSCLVGVGVANVFFYMGFWNFSFSTVLLLFTVGYWLRHAQRWTGRSLMVLALGACLVYAAHVVSWVVCVLAVTVLGVSNLVATLCAQRDGLRLPPFRRLGRPVLQFAIPVCAALLPAAPASIHAAHGEWSPEFASRTSLWETLWPLLKLSFLRTLANADWMVAMALAATLLLLVLALAGVAAVRREYEWRTNSILLLALTCAAVAVAGPDRVGGGLFISSRVAFVAFLFFLAWISAALRRWPRLWVNAVPALFCCLAVVSVAIRVPALADWDDRLSAFVVIGESIRPGSTVLQLNLESRAGIDPSLHAVGLLSAKGIVDLRNYEARGSSFSTRFRPEMSPFPALGTMSQLQGSPPVFDVARYERETRGRVDYLLFQGGNASGEVGGTRPEVVLYRDQLAAFAFVASSGGGRLRLYERSDGTRLPYLMPSRQAIGKAVNIAILNHVVYGNMVRLKMSAHASNSATTMPASRPPILDASQVAAVDVAPHARTATPKTQCG